MPLAKGRTTIRRRAPMQLAGNPMVPVDSRENRRIRIWDLEPKPGTTIAKLESTYLAVLDAVDKIGEYKANAIKSNKFTKDGVADQTLQYALNKHIPTCKRGRNTIATAKKEAAALRDKIKLQPVVVGFLQRQDSVMTTENGCSR
jgi:glutamine phosphoribosylpyrophosphate amidotransferase